MAASATNGHGSPDADARLFERVSYAPEDIIERDVAVVGGGSSGTYAAVRLRDHGKTVVLIEQTHKLGGHADTYKDPDTGVTLDLGVIVWGHLPEVYNYFNRFAIRTKIMPSIGQPDYVDMASGQPISYSPPSDPKVAAALERYATQLLRYPKLQRGWYLDDPVPEDLLLPFGAFVDKYSLHDMMPLVFSVCQGYIPLLDISTLYVFKYLNADLLNTLRKGFLTTASSNAGELYERAADYLTPANVLINAEIVGTARTASSARIALTTATADGLRHRLVLAKRIIYSAPPLASSNMSAWDLSAAERALFAKWRHNAFYSAALHAPGFRGQPPIHRATLGAPCALPPLPGIYAVNCHETADLVQVYYGAPAAMDTGAVQAEIVAALARIQAARGVHGPPPRLRAFAAHVPFNMMVSNDDIRGGFYAQLYALQGLQGTYYNGAAFHAQDSSVLWRFNEEEILPRVLADLG